MMHSSRARSRPLSGGPIQSSTKRKAPAAVTICATTGASDDDSSDNKAGRHHQDKRTRTETSEETASAARTPCAVDAAGPSTVPMAKKKKEFAWMDSDEEDGEGSGQAQEGDKDGEGSGHARGHNKATAENGSQGRQQAGEGDSDENVEVTVEVLNEVQSFGRMMLMAPSLRKWLQSGRREPADAVAACLALARTRFFDADLLEDLYAVLRKLLRSDRLDNTQTHGVILCVKELNVYDKAVFSAIARAFRAKTATLDASARALWLDIFRGYGHEVERDFLQLLEVPPLAPTMPSYRKVRCWHHSKGICMLEGTCSYSHDARAPLSLVEGGREDWWRSKSVMMTQNQKTLGDGAYGLGALGRANLLGPSH